MTPLQELLKDKSKEDFFDELVQACIDEKLSTTAWQPGEPMRAVMVVVARVLAWLWSLVALPALRAAFLDYAEGAWLTLYAWTFYNVKRKGAEFASRTLTVENRGAYAGPIAAGSVRIKNSVTGKTFTNTTGTSFLAAWSGSGAYPTVDLAFTADEAGTASDTPSGYIETQPITAPLGVYVLTNAAAMLGSDEETDPDLRVRCRASSGPLSPAGPVDAYRFVALSTTLPDGTPVSVNRVRVVDVGACTLQVFLAGRSGPTPGDMVTAGSPVFEVYQRLLKTVLPTGMKLYVYPATAASATLAINVVVGIDSGTTAEEAQTAAYDAVAAFLSEVPIGGFRSTPLVNATDPGTLYVSEITAKASESIKGIVRATCSPSTDIALSYDAIPDVTLTVTTSMVKQS